MINVILLVRLFSWLVKNSFRKWDNLFVMNLNWWSWSVNSVCLLIMVGNRLNRLIYHFYSLLRLWMLRRLWLWHIIRMSLIRRIIPFTILLNPWRNKLRILRIIWCVLNYVSHVFILFLNLPLKILLLNLLL